MSAPDPLEPLAFPLHGARLIEASAGTGKTWTIAALYVRLVLGHGGAAAGFGRPLLPPEILVVTFTEAATGELRDRIRQRLAEAARCFRGLAAADGFVQGLIDSYGAAGRAACARRLEVAAQWMDEAAVYTIHGWCNRMLRQHAFDSASLFKLDIEARDGELLREVARDYWRCFFYPLDAAASLAVAKLADGPDGLLERVHGLLREGGADWRDGERLLAGEAAPVALLAQWGVWEAERRGLESQARAAWAAGRAELDAWLREASANGWLSGSVYRKDSFEARLQGLADWAESGAPCRPEWLAGFAQSRLKLNKAHADKLLRHPAFAALDDLAEHAGGEPDFERELLAHAARWLRARYAQEKQILARLDFDDLLTHLHEALRRAGGARLAEAIRRQYPVALVDEFQDTDPVQYGIFAAVYPPGEAVGTAARHGFFMIGDPKQAIYSFRGADIFTYLKARAATQGRHYTLQTNFRSSAAMVAAVNRWFEHAETQPGGAFKFKPEVGENPLPFHPVQARGREAEWRVEGRPAPALTLWLLAAEDGEAVGMAAYRQAMAASAATAIAHLLNQAACGGAGFEGAAGWQPLRPADIAVLVRDRGEAGAVRRALAERGLRSVYLSERESVFASPEAGDLLLWLAACAEPADDRRLRAALGTATLDLGYAGLERLNLDEREWEGEVERFRGYRKTWREQGVLPMLRRLLADFHVPARLLGLAEGERRLTNLLHLAELLQAASVELDGEQALIRHLAEARADGGQAADEALLRLESDADLIKVVTVHKSKGLEYPLVFLPFVCSFRETTARQGHYRYHDAAGRLQLDLAKTEAAKREAERERVQEEVRLLYVALTRSIHACWLGLAPVKSGNAKACQLEKSAVGQALAGGAAIPGAALASCLEALRDGCAAIAVAPPPPPSLEPYAPPAAEAALAAAKTFPGRATERWWIASYSALQVESESEAAAPLRLEAPDTPRQANLEEAAGEEQGAPPAPAVGAPDMHRFPRGAKPGTFLHGLLEWAARAGFGRAAADAALRKDAIARRCHTRGWMPWVNVLDEWLERLLTLPMGLPDGPAALAGLRVYQPELEFWLASSQVDTLALDRLVTRHTLAAAPRPKLLPDRLNGMLKGFMDLVFEQGGRYYVADYKSNWLGPDAAAYTAEALAGAVLESRYELQYALYLLALHRQLRVRLGAEYDYDRHIGGAVYIFLRGLEGPTSGLHLERPPRVLIETLDGLFAGAGELGHAA